MDNKLKKIPLQVILQFKDDTHDYCSMNPQAKSIQCIWVFFGGLGWL